MNILTIYSAPPSAFNAGGLRVLDLYNEIGAIEPSVTLYLIALRAKSGDYDLQFGSGVFDHIQFSNSIHHMKNIIDSFVCDGVIFDVIDFQGHHSGSYIRICRQYWPDAKLIFSPLESQVGAAIINIKSIFSANRPRFKDFLGGLKNALFEVFYANSSNLVCCVSHFDKKCIGFVKNIDSIININTCLSNEFLIENFKVGSSVKSCDIVYFAYFLSQTNIEALNWYLDHVHPIIAAKFPNYKFRVFGYGINRLAPLLAGLGNVEILYDVSNINCALYTSKIAIAPALSGAGVRGKIHQYSAMKVPCVASSIASRSLKYTNGDSIFIADKPIDFANKCIALLSDVDLRDRIAQSAYDICIKYYTWKSVRSQIYESYLSNLKEL